MSITREVYDAVARQSERQLQNWSHRMQVADRIEHERAIAETKSKTHPFITLSRESGANGNEVGLLVAQALGGKLLGRELIHEFAMRYHVSERMCEFVDEHSPNWFYDWVLKWMEDDIVSQPEYLMHLKETLLEMARAERLVVIGRGAQFMLPRESGLAIRIIAPLSQRIARVMQKYGLNRSQAETHIRDTERGRRDFVQHFFQRDATDPHLYDLIINMKHRTPQEAASLIVQQFQHRFG